MRTNTTHSGTLLLLLARPADSLCTIIQSWAMAHHWGDLVLCHSVYDINTRLGDIAPQQPVILITRPAMLNKPFLTSVLQKRPDLRLIGWTGTEQTTSEQFASTIPDTPIVTVNSAGQLKNIIRAFQTTPVREQADHDRQPDAITDARIEPKNYRLSDDEINALLGAG